MPTTLMMVASSHRIRPERRTLASLLSADTTIYRDEAVRLRAAAVRLDKLGLSQSAAEAVQTAGRHEDFAEWLLQR